jgi:hypothetical protein
MRRSGFFAMSIGVAVIAAAGIVAAQDAPSKSGQTPALAPVASPQPAPALAATPPAASEDDDAAPAPKVAASPAAPEPPPEPLKRPRFTAAVLQGVDKITAETMRFEAKVGEPVRFRGMIVTIRACETTASDEGAVDSIAYADVLSQPEVLPGRAAAPPRAVFHGWMFASSPSLHPLEHPVYDLWLIACKTATPGT